MSTSITPTYRVEFSKVSGASHLTSFAYRGKKNVAGLKAFVDAYNKSFAEGGVNFIAGSPVLVILETKLVNQYTGIVVATYKGEQS